ncbi:MAG: DUF6599 family protein [Planctomycetota bacterium]|jgi:hypothetical protein
MRSVPGRAKHLESAISICLLAILFLIAVGVFIKQMPKQKKDLSFLLPYGFKTLSEIEVYNSGNLYEKINGKAPLYIDAGFTKLSTQRFASQADENLVMELYIFDMARARNAFSVYSVQKRAEVETLPDMEFAYKTSNALYLTHGEYYIELIGFSESDELFAAMAEVTRKIRTNLVVHDDTGIPEIEYLPQDNLVPGSIKLYLTSAFGFEGLTDIFAAKYEFNGETITAFLSKRPDPRDAEVVAESYRNFLIENGATARKTAKKILEGKVLDFYDTTEIVLSIGPFIIGVHEAENQQSAEKLAVMLINKLSEAAKAVNND